MLLHLLRQNVLKLFKGKRRIQMSDAVENYAKEYAKRHAEEFAKNMSIVYKEKEYVGFIQRQNCGRREI